MIDDILVPTERLSDLDSELEARISSVELPDDVKTGEIGQALRRALLFERWPDLLEGEVLSPEQRRYNQYYWFTRFVTLKRKRDGYDAGLEQQSFKILEDASEELDWDLVEQITAAAQETGET